MTFDVKWRKYVGHERIQSQIMAGWVIDYSSVPMHHDKYGISMLWPHPGDPPGQNTIDDRHDAMMGEFCEIMAELQKAGDHGEFQP